MNDQQQPEQPQPQFDPDAPHQQKPRLRPVRGFPVKQGEQVLLGLADASQISSKMIFTVPQVQAILPHMDGEKELDTIVAEVGHGLQREMLEQIVAQLDNAGLLEGPTFEAMLEEMRAEYDKTENLPPASTAQFADALVMQKHGQEATDEQKQEEGPALLSERLEEFMDKALEEAQDPSFDALPRAVFAPHLDYARGWQNYAHTYGRMRVVDRPDRVVILGTNHFGRGTGVVGCDKGFETPLGTTPFDQEFAGLLEKHLGAEDNAKLYKDRYDHEREHSIELHIPWIQKVFGSDSGGNVPVFAALVHDPTHNAGDSYDDAGLGLDPFVDALREAIKEAPGKTLVVASVDLSHVGPAFGDEITLVGEEPQAVEFRNRVLQHDQAMLKILERGEVNEMLTSISWQQNHTRWCSLGAITAAMRATDAEGVRIMNYGIGGDQQGQACVSSFAGVIA